MTKALKYLSLFLLSLLVLLTFTAWGVSRTPWAQNQIRQLIEKQVGKNSEYSLRLKRFQWDFPIAISVDRMTLTRDTQEVAQLSNFSLDLELLPLMWGKLSFREIEAGEVRIAQIPESASKGPSPNLEKLIPGQISVHHLKIDALHFPEDAKDLPPLSLEGELSFSPWFGTGYVNLSAGPQGRTRTTHLELNLAQSYRTLRIRGSLEEAEEGYLRALIPHLNDPHLAFDAAVNLSTLGATADLNFHANISGDREISADVSLSSDFREAVQIAEALITTEGAELKAHGKYLITDDKFDIALEASVDELSSWLHVLPFSVSGNFRASGGLAGTLQSPDLEIFFPPQQFSIDQTPFEIDLGRIELTRASEKWSGLLALKGFWGEEPVAVDAYWQQPNSDAPHPVQFKLMTGPNRLEGTLGIGTALSGDITFSLPNLELLTPWIGTDIEGQAEGKISIEEIQQSEDFWKGSISMAATSKVFQWDSVKVKRAECDVQFIFNGEELTGAVNFNGKKVSWNGSPLGELFIHTRTEGVSPEWHYEVDLRQKEELLQSFGVWSYTANAFRLNPQSLQGTLRGFPLQLFQPFEFIVRDDESVSLTPFTLSIDQGTIQGELELNEQVKGLIEAKDFPMEWLRYLDDEWPLEAKTHARFQLEGTKEAPSMEISLSFDEGYMIEEQFSGFGELKGMLHGKYQGTETVIEGEISGWGEHPGTIVIKLPTEIRFAPATFSLPIDKAFSANIQATGPIGPLVQTIFPKAILVNGRAELSLNASGTLSEPKVEGKIELRDGVVESFDFGTLITDVEATLYGQGNRLELTRLRGSTAQGGTIEGTGNMKLSVEEDFPFTVEGILSGMNLVNLDSFQADASGAVTFSGNTKKALLKGRLMIDKGKVILPEESSVSIEDLDVVYINQPLDRPPPSIIQKRKDEWPIHLDLDVQTDSSLPVTRGKDFKSQWKGKMEVKGTTTSPLLYGECKIVKGEYFLNGKSFTLNEGTITFQGDPEKNTSLYIVIGKEIDRYKIEIVLKGPIKDPNLSFRSTPALTQREILSWILFNRGLAEISPYEGAQLSESYISIKNLKNEGPDLFTQIRNSTGLDRIDISRKGVGDESDVTLQVGKYISRGIYVGLDKSFTTEADKLRIEADLFKNIKVEAEVGQEADSQLLLKWRRDY